MSEVQKSTVEVVDAGKAARAEVVAGAKVDAAEIKSEIKDIQVGFKTYHAGEWPRKEADRKDAKTPENGKTYTAIGAVDRIPFKPEVRSFEWYLTMGQYARHMARDFNRIDFQFPGLKNIPKNEKARQKILAIIKKVSGASISAAVVDDPVASAKAFKKALDAEGSSEEIYGAQGVLNVVLAYGRASDQLKGVTPENAGSIDYKLELGNKRYSKLFERKKKETKKAEKADSRREDFDKQAKKADKGQGEIFNDQMNEYLAERNDLTARIGAAVENGKMKHEDAYEYREALNKLDLRDAVSRKEMSDSDLARLELTDATINRVKAAVEKAEKPAQGAASAPRESYDEQETKVLVEKILNMNPMKDRYELAEGQTLDQLAGVIAFDVVKLIDPVAGKGVLENLSKLVQPIILAALNNIHKANVANNTPSKIFILDKSTQQRVVLLLLSELKKNKIQSNAMLKMRA